LGDTTDAAAYQLGWNKESTQSQSLDEPTQNDQSIIFQGSPAKIQLVQKILDLSHN
jgi:hypothetical protein